MRLWASLIAYNLGNLWRRLVLPVWHSRALHERETRNQPLPAPLETVDGNRPETLHRKAVGSIEEQEWEIQNGNFGQIVLNGLVTEYGTLIACPQ